MHKFIININSCIVESIASFVASTAYFVASTACFVACFVENHIFF
ncbi:MAG: hypothetical protein OCD02_08550 [Spirochaetaceae bacterium]